MAELPHVMGLERPDNDRRRHQRAPFGGLVRFESDGKVLTANAEEVSETGMRLEVPWNMTVDSKVEVYLPLRGKGGRVDTCKLSGRVVRRSRHSVGVRFDRLLPRHMLQLRDYVWRSMKTAFFFLGDYE